MRLLSGRPQVRFLSGAPNPCATSTAICPIRRRLPGVPARLDTAEAIAADRGTYSSDRSPEQRRPVMTEPVLEPAAQELADATAKPPYLYELGPDGARKVLDDIQ